MAKVVLFLKATLLLFSVMKLCEVQGSRSIIGILYELPSFIDDNMEQVIKSTLTDKVFGAARWRSARSIGLDCVNRLDERSCQYLASVGYCNLRRASMEVYCQRACKFCVDPPCGISRYGCCFDNKTLAKGPNMYGCDDDCKDRLGKIFCRNLKIKGECYKDHEQASRGCAITCGYCRPCEDDDPVGCELAAKFSACSLKRGQMTNICRKSCNACGRRDPCFQFACPKGSVCMVDKHMKPFCKCHGKCDDGDQYTGKLCGRDGVEYKNLCELKKVNCGHPEIDQITVKNYGRCQGKGVAQSDRRTLCSKKEPLACRLWASRGYCKTRGLLLKKMCPKSCGVCRSPIQPKDMTSCHYSKFGCCLDKKTACKGTGYKGCPKYPACRDFSKTFCKRFVPVCGSENHKSKMAAYCPVSCRVCHQL